VYLQGQKVWQMGRKKLYSGTNAQWFVHPALYTRLLPQPTPLNMKVASSSKMSVPIYQLPHTAAQNVSTHLPTTTHRCTKYQYPFTNYHTPLHIPEDGSCRIFPSIKKSTDSSSCSQQPTTESHFEPDQSGSQLHSQTTSLISILILSSHLHLVLLNLFLASHLI